MWPTIGVTILWSRCENGHGGDGDVYATGMATNNHAKFEIQIRICQIVQVDVNETLYTNAQAAGVTSQTLNFPPLLRAVYSYLGPSSAAGVSG
jgi:hypothetical protein